MQIVEKYDWNDKTCNIEELLKQFPVVKDHRQPDEIYQLITPKLKKKKQLTWFIPSAASLASIAVMIIIGSSILQYPETSTQEKSLKKDQVTESFDTAEAPYDFSETAQRFTVQEDQNFITFGLSDSKGIGIIIPISVITDKKEDLSLQEYKSHFNKIPNEEWGLNEADLENVKTISIANKDKKREKVIINLEPNSSLSSSSRGGAFLTAITESFRYQHFSEVEFQTDGKTGATIENKELTKLPIDATGKNAFFEYMYDQDYPIFLTRSNKEYDTLTDAIANMESENFKWKAPLHPPIPGGVDIKSVKADEETKHVTITFSENSGLIDNQNYIMMLDSLLLTARDFGYQTVTFSGAENAKIERIGEIKLNTVIPVPVAPNPVILH